MAVKIDIVDGSGLEVTQKKWTKTRIATVTGLTPGTSYAMENQARTASGIPQIGAALGPMKVVSHSVELTGPTSAKVVIRYETGYGAPQADPENPNLPVYEVGTQLQQYNTTFLPDGVTPIKVKYGDVEYASSVTVDSSAYTLRVSRVEPGILPGDVAKALLNKVNSVAWQGGAPGTWRCVNVQGVSADGGLTWEMMYEFLYLEAKHQPIAVAIDPSTGEMFPDANLTDENGSKELAWYETFNFSLLGI